MDRVELAMATEEEFGITISDREAEAIATPRQLIEFVLEKAPQQTRPDVAAWVKKVVIELLGVAEKNYDEDSDFVRDLGLN